MIIKLLCKTNWLVHDSHSSMITLNPWHKACTFLNVSMNGTFVSQLGYVPVIPLLDWWICEGIQVEKEKVKDNTRRKIKGKKLNSFSWFPYHFPFLDKSFTNLWSKDILGIQDPPRHSKFINCHRGHNLKDPMVVHWIWDLRRKL